MVARVEDVPGEAQENAEEDGSSKRRYRELLREAHQIMGSAEEMDRVVSSLAKETEELIQDCGADVVEESLRQLEAKARHLQKLRSRMSVVEAEVIACLDAEPSLAALRPMRAMKTKISFSESVSVKHVYSEDPLIHATMPGHGHWIETEKGTEPQQEATLARLLGGHLEKIPINSPALDVVDFVMVEPMVKRLDPDSFTCSGVILCLHGQFVGNELLREWSEVLKGTRLLDAGFILAMPLLPAPDPTVEDEDLEALTLAAMSAAGASNCLVIGKAWAGPWAAEVAAMAASQESALFGKIAGLICFAPSKVPIDVLKQALRVPSMIVWAEDDEEMDFEENSPEWTAALHTAPPPSLWVVVEEGGHALASICRQQALALGGMQVVTGVSHFMIACQLRALISAHLRANVADGDQALPQEIGRMCEELPEHMSQQLGGNPGAREDVLQAVERCCQESGVRTALLRLDSVLGSWLRGNLQPLRAYRGAATSGAKE